MNRVIFLSMMLLSSWIVPLSAFDESLSSDVEFALQQPAPLVHAVWSNNTDLVKILIDNNEDVNLATPPYLTEPGDTPLDMAIMTQNKEMVEILLYYHPTNRANHDYTISKYVGDTLWTTTPLLEAIRRGNEDIVDLILKAFRDPQRLDACFNDIRMSQRPEFMRSWIAQTMFLWKNKTVEIPDEVVTLYMQASAHEALTHLDVEAFKTLVQYGALVNGSCFWDVLHREYTLISFVFTEARFTSDFSPGQMWEDLLWNSF